MKRSEQIGELVAALAKAQSEFTAAVKDSENPYYNSKYADLNAVINAVRPALNKNGIAMMHNLESDLERQVAIVTVGLYCGEQFMEIEVEAPATGKGKKDVDDTRAPTRFDVQTIGAAWTYLRRYSLQAICGLASEDDDGNALQGSNKPIPRRLTPAQAVSRENRSAPPPDYEPNLPSESISQPPVSPQTKTEAQTPTGKSASSQGATHLEGGGIFTLLPPDNDTLICTPQGITDKMTKPADGKTAPKPYLVIKVNGFLRPQCDPDNPNINGIFCYDAKLFDAVKSGVGKQCLLKIDLSGKFAKLLDVFEVDGAEYRDGKPVLEEEK